MRNLLLLPVLALLLIPGTASAATSSITLDRATPAYQTAVTFTTTVEKLKGWQHPMIAVSCYQDVNGDGTIDTSLSGPDSVYVQLDQPGTSFLLGGYSSPWIDRGGGAAECRADLDAYGFKGGAESVVVLDSVTFNAAG